MKHLIIIFNVIFLLAGNVLFLNIHYLKEHNHDDHDYHTCQECVNLNNSNQYISNANNIKFLKNKTFQFVFEYFSGFEFISSKIYLSRAPPLS